MGILFLFMLLLALSTGSAQAYIDPGTGSYFLQFLIAGLFGSLFFLKQALSQGKKLIRSPFKFIKKQSSKTDNEVK
ncbi:MAG: hypothetical protein A3J50_02595 [Candidatus Woykebacteria bacterium RIFCSPHIGHO2_02_FULL_43_16b]|nr:MAG: hypothetical protein A3J50_02595 [Candidatus Woykebacteria bacterium RIFCSPHIGHO2_02_FULL_43_16b]